MNILHRPTFAEQAAQFAFQTFFALVKAILITIFLIGVVLIAGQSTVSPVSVRLLTTYGMEYAVSRFKPYRDYFPEPYVRKFDMK